MYAGAAARFVVGARRVAPPRCGRRSACLGARLGPASSPREQADTVSARAPCRQGVHGRFPLPQDQPSAKAYPAGQGDAVGSWQPRMPLEGPRELARSQRPGKAPLRLSLPPAQYANTLCGNWLPWSDPVSKGVLAPRRGAYRVDPGSGGVVADAPQPPATLLHPSGMTNATPDGVPDSGRWSRAALTTGSAAPAIAPRMGCQKHVPRGPTRAPASLGRMPDPRDGEPETLAATC